MNEDDPHMTVGALMIHLRMPATWYEKILEPPQILELEKILFLVLAMLDCGMSLYDLQLRLTGSDQ